MNDFHVNTDTLFRNFMHNKKDNDKTKKDFT